MASPSIKLRGGNSMPALGFGTYLSQPGEVKAAVAKAVEVGFRHFDFAKVYMNQKEAGEGIKEGLLRVPGLKRQDLFIVSKLWCTQHGAKNVPSALDDCLAELGLDYLDLYLVHFPYALKTNDPNNDLFTPVDDTKPDESLIDFDSSIFETWRAMTELPKSKVRAVGGCNFSIKHLEAIIEATGQVPEVIQTERHPKLQEKDLLAFAANHNIAITSHTPLGNNQFGKPKITDHSVVKEIAGEVGATPAQVTIAWALAHGCAVIPKTVTLHRVAENYGATQVHLPTDAVKRIDAIGDHESERLCIGWLVTKGDPHWRVNTFNTESEKDLPEIVLK